MPDASQEPYSPEFGRTWADDAKAEAMAAERAVARLEEQHRPPALPECLGGVERAEEVDTVAILEARIATLLESARRSNEATSALAKAHADLVRRSDRLVKAITDHRASKLPREWTDADAELYGAVSAFTMAQGVEPSDEGGASA